MVRFSVVKLGQKLEDIVAVEGRARWRREDAPGEGGLGGLPF